MAPMSTASPRPAPAGVESVLDFVREHVRARPDATAALVKRDGKYRPVSWRELWEASEQVARALVGAGVEASDRVCIAAQTSLDWVTTDLGILAAGAVTVPVYPSSVADEARHVADHSGAKVIFCEDAVQTQKVLSVRDALPGVTRVVQMTGTPPDADGWVVTMSDFLAGASSDPDLLEPRRRALQPDSMLTIIYTSGTTGRPKGVVLTHANMIYEGRAIQAIGVVRHDDVQLLFLPLAHVFAKVLEVAWFATGHVMGFAENMNTIKQNLGEVRPTLMCGVPRIFEKFYGAVVDKGMAAEGLRRRLFEDALALSRRHGEAEERGEQLPLADRLYFALLRRIVFAKVRAGVMETLGGRMRVMVSGGAPLSKRIAWFFRDADIVILEGYGMTESSAATCANLPGRNQIGTVGPPIDGSEVRIADDGEILIRGPGVMREYWQEPAATAETLADGWLHTGDIGEIDPRTGAVRITDRKKDLIVTAGGKNVAPQKIENLLKAHELISQAVVHGDRRKFLSALITLDEAVLTTTARTLGLQGTYAELAGHASVQAQVERLVTSTNRELASYESIKRFHVLDRDFSIEGGELTPKLSVKRKVVDRKYGHLFDQFYEEKF
jgi:long-chain acyl-CoA synthetase